MNFTLWYSSRDFANWLVVNTQLQTLGGALTLQPLAESDAAKPTEFHRMPDHLKQILYLDAPDAILEIDGDPVVSVEVSREAGTGHNAFQRFARVAAAVENHVPALYIYPEAALVQRGASVRWDRLNPNVFKALERLMDIYDVPALLFYHPSHFNGTLAAPRMLPGKGMRMDATHPSSPDATDGEMQKLFAIINLIIRSHGSGRGGFGLVKTRPVVNRRAWMNTEFVSKGGAGKAWSPLTATTTIPTKELIDYIRLVTKAPTALSARHMLLSRDETVIYSVGSAGIRADPYAGALAALDYIECRLGPTFEERDKNLAMAWGAIDQTGPGIKVISSAGASVDDFFARVSTVRSNLSRCLLHASSLAALTTPAVDIPRYYMQARYGCSFTKAKEIRIFSFFADALLFQDGALWREG